MESSKAGNLVRPKGRLGSSPRPSATLDALADRLGAGLQILQAGFDSRAHLQFCGVV